MNITEYLGESFFGLKFPVHVFVEGLFRFEDVVCQYNPKKELKLPDDVVIYKNKLVKQKETEAKQKGAPFYDGPMVRLDSFGINIEDWKTEKQKLILNLSPTSFFTYVATNRSLDEKILYDKHGNKVSIKGKYIKDPLNWCDSLANPIGVDALIVSEPDHKLVIAKRSEKVSLYRNCYHVPAGFMDPKKDADSAGTPNPFLTMKRELEEEVGVHCNLDDMILFGVARDLNDLHAELFGEVRTDMTEEEIRSSPKRDKYEGNLIYLDYEIEPVLKYIKNAPWPAENPPKPEERWVPVGPILLLHSLYKEFGYDKVKEVARRIFK